MRAIGTRAPTGAIGTMIGFGIQRVHDLSNIGAMGVTGAIGTICYENYGGNDLSYLSGSDG